MAKRRYTVQKFDTQIRLIPEYVKGYEKPKNFDRVVIDRPDGQAFGFTCEELANRRWIDVEVQHQ